MKLSEIINLKVGEAFLYQNEPAIVVWVENLYHTEDKGAAVCFAYGSETKVVTLRTGHPSPDVIGMADFEPNKAPFRNADFRNLVGFKEII